MGLATAEIKLDAQTIGAFERELEEQESIVIKRVLPDYKAANGTLFQIKTTNQPGIETSSFKMVDGVGMMELRSGRSTNLPEVELTGEEFTQRAYSYDTGYRLSETEIAASLLRQIPIEEQKIQLVQQVYTEHLNKITLFGDRKTGTPGFINHPAWLRFVAPSKLDSSVADTDSFLATLNAPVQAMKSATGKTMKPDTLLLPERRYDYLTSQARLTTLNDKSVLSFFLANNPSIRNIDYLPELEEAGPNGEDIAIAYKRDPSCFHCRIIDAFRPRPLFQVNPFEVYRAYSFKYLGFKVYQKYSAVVMIGV